MPHKFMQLKVAIGFWENLLGSRAITVLESSGVLSHVLICWLPLKSELNFNNIWSQIFMFSFLSPELFFNCTNPGWILLEAAYKAFRVSRAEQNVMILEAWPHKRQFSTLLTYSSACRAQAKKKEIRRSFYIEQRSTSFSLSTWPQWTS